LRTRSRLGTIRSMKKPSPQPTLASSVSLALVAIATATGCGSNALPAIPVPKPDDQAALPEWYPEAPWTASSGQSRIFIEGKIVFDTDKAIIRPGSEKVLKTLLRFMTEHPEVTLLRVEGHTDDIASDEHNQELSARRALAVCDWLVDQKVDHTRLLAVGFGKSKPMAPNDRAAGRQENRRTEFHVAEVDGRQFNPGGKGAKDPTAGGYVLIVKSAEERRREKELAAMPKTFPKLKPFVPTGDEVKQVTPTAAPEPKVPVDKDKKGGT
jgi:outer membrane protein OmpA-like peptidoglycan-associated protein